jgi:hypothetical protein
MDMKKILQAIDGVSTSPVENSAEMKKFVQVVTEGASPHKVTLPVQMAMNHYQKPVVKKNSIIRKYFEQVEETAIQHSLERKQLIQQYAQKISQRVLENSYRRDAYERDYDSSISGMSSRRGRTVDDEANLMYIYDKESSKLKQKMIDVRDESQAKSKGFRYEQKDALKLAGIISSKFHPGKWVQKDTATGKWVEVHPFGNTDK